MRLMTRVLWSGFILSALAGPAAAQNAGSTSGPVMAEPQEIPNYPVVQVGVFRMRPDGTVVGSAYATGEKPGESIVSGIASSACGLGGGERWLGDAMPAWAVDAWEVRGQVVDVTDGQATVQLDWTRVRTGGAASTRSDSRRLTLPLDQLVELDRAMPAPESACPRASDPVVFGARFANRFPPGAVVGGRVGGAARAGAGFSGGGSGDSSSGGLGRGGVALVAAGRMAPYVAELWLVRSVPGQPDQVVPLTVRVENGRATFRFASLTFPAADGTVSVQVEGSVRLAGPSGQAPVLLLLQVLRSATFVPANRPSRDPGDPKPPVRFSSSREFPKPDDVIAFEMPAVELAGGRTLPDDLSVRLRVRPE